MTNYQGVCFFDLDGTLLNNQSQISLDNKRVLEQLEKNNYLSVIASGRAPFEIEKIMQETSINSYISLNGQYVVIDGKVASAHSIDRDLVRDVLTVGLSLGAPVSCYTPNTYVINFGNQTAKKLYQLGNAPFPKIDPTFSQHETTYMLYLFTERLEDDLVFRERFGNQLTFYRDSPYSLAIVNQHRSKKRGILEVIEKLGLSDSEQTFAFGDGNNDLSMFEVVKHKIAMGNATAEVKAAADFVTFDNETNGIYHALKEFNVI